MQEQRPAGAQRAAQPPPVLVHLLGADVLDHPDRGDGVVGLAGEVAVVREAEVDEVADAGLLREPARALDLRRRDGDAGHVHAVALGGVDREARPSPSRRRARAGRARARASGRSARAWPPGPPPASSRPREKIRARVGHRRAEEEPEELRRDVVVVAHRARVALARMEAPARRQLGRGRRRRAHDAGGAAPRRASGAPCGGGRSRAAASGRAGGRRRRGRRRRARPRRRRGRARAGRARAGRARAPAGSGR